MIKNKVKYSLNATLIVCFSQASQSLLLFLQTAFPVGNIMILFFFFSVLTLYLLALSALAPIMYNVNAYLVVLCHYCTLSRSVIVHAAGAKVKDLEDEADRLLEKLQPIKRLQDNLRRNISQIKELINQARKQANSVSCHQENIITYITK